MNFCCIQQEVIKFPPRFRIRILFFYIWIIFFVLSIQEVELFSKPEVGLELLKSVLSLISTMDKDDQTVLEDLWFAGFHFNMVVLTLKGTSS